MSMSMSISTSTTVSLSDAQLALLKQPIEGTYFLTGPAGTGKTTAGVHWMLRLLQAGVPARHIFVWVPQRTLSTPYYEMLHRPTVEPGGQVAITTLGGLAQRMVDLFWPLVAAEAGFAHPDEDPVFLTLETAQYYMARLVRPLLEAGYFEGVVIDRNRLYSQILDDLNKAAVVGFPHTEIGERLKSAWVGEQSQRRVYDEAQVCAHRFREYCLAHNLLDFSLQVEVFIRYLWPHPLCRSYLLETYTHLIVDNVEEDVPVAHDVIREWLGHCRSALVICDDDAGYRRFLGADPQSGRALAAACDRRIMFTGSHVLSPPLAKLSADLARHMHRSFDAEAGADTVVESPQAAVVFEYHRYHPQMLDWVVDEIARLVHEEQVPAGQIAVLAPFLSDALRFSVVNRLERRGVPVRSHRPSRALRDEPAARCLLTWAAVAHPHWGLCPTRFDIAYALMQTITGIDLVRAQLLAEIVYRPSEGRPDLTSFDAIRPEMQERFTFTLGERYERLRRWLLAYGETSSQPLDFFLSHLFGDVLSTEGYRFHTDYDAVTVAAALIESVRKFRWAADEIVGGDGDGSGNESGNGHDLGREYLEMVRDGVIAAQYILGWRLQPEDAVLLAPAYTFLMRNQPVDYQFWLSVGGRGWWERLYQPLTHPYVLSRRWPADRLWTDEDEFAARQETLFRLVIGLIRRCRQRVYLGLSELGEQGYEQKGPLLQVIQRVLREYSNDGVSTTT